MVRVLLASSSILAFVRVTHAPEKRNRQDEEVPSPWLSDRRCVFHGVRREVLSYEGNNVQVYVVVVVIHHAPGIVGNSLGFGEEVV